MAHSIVVWPAANMTSVTSRSPEDVKEPDSSAAFLRESIRRVAIIGIKIALELFPCVRGQLGFFDRVGRRKLLLCWEEMVG